MKVYLERVNDTSFTLTGKYCATDHGSDAFQLIYEALEIAAHSNDKFASEFAALRDEILEQSKDWAD